MASRTPRGTRQDDGVGPPQGATPPAPDDAAAAGASDAPPPADAHPAAAAEGRNAAEGPDTTASATTAARRAGRDKEGKGGVAVDGFTIGEVLNQLRDDFEDITISKIRFLESEGLISPGRTESGYRKFSGDDVDRLRFILIAQRDHFLPLKVIREQLARVDAGEAATTPAGTVVPAGGGGDASTTTATAEGAASDQADAPPAAAPSEELRLSDDADEPVSLTWREFCDATELDAGEVKALRDYGIIGTREEDQPTFDGDDLVAGLAARELLHLGLEARHLRMYRQFVDREVALFEQLVTPLLRQRNPQARRQAVERLEELAGLTGRMKRSLLRRELRGTASGS